MRNERTSKKVARIAAKIMGLVDQNQEYILLGFTRTGCRVIVTTDDIKALAASALTQAPDKKK